MPSQMHRFAKKVEPIPGRLTTGPEINHTRKNGDRIDAQQLGMAVKDGPDLQIGDNHVVQPGRPPRSALRDAHRPSTRVSGDVLLVSKVSGVESVGDDSEDGRHHSGLGKITPSVVAHDAKGLVASISSHPRAQMARRASTPSSYPPTTHGSAGYSSCVTPASRRESDVMEHHRALAEQLAANLTKEGTSTSQTSSIEVTQNAVRGEDTEFQIGPVTPVRQSPRVTSRFLRTTTPLRLLQGFPSADHPQQAGVVKPGVATHSHGVRRGDIASPQPVRVDLRARAVGKMSDMATSIDHESLQSEWKQQAVDYTMDELGRMDFCTLQSESIDRDAPLESFSPIHTDEGLSYRLKYALETGDGGHQEALLKTLDIGAWEEAGDWFVQQSSTFMNRMVKLRRDKRRLALDLEKQIAGRYAVVGRKREVLDESVEELRRNGQRVVPSTPRKRAPCDVPH